MKYYGNLPQPDGKQKMILLKLAGKNKTTLATEIHNWQQEEIARRLAAGDSGIKSRQIKQPRTVSRRLKVPKTVASILKENEGKPLKDYIISEPNPIFDMPEYFPDVDSEVKIHHVQEGLVPIIKEDVEGPRIPPFIQVRLFKHFKKHGIEQTLEAIEVYHKKAMHDPEEFKEIYGPDLTNLIIQL